MMMKRPINWRELVLLYAAKILDEFHEPELAKALRDYRVPMVDGGGMKRINRKDGTWQIDSGSWQQLPKPGDGEMVLLPLPSHLWDPPKEKACCDCCRHRKAG